MRYLKVEVFIPETHLETLVEAVNNAGLMREGAYDYAYATSRVQGHFRPLAGAQPFIGHVNEVTEVAEVKVEFRIAETDYQRADLVIRQAHPYEVPVINYLMLY